MHHHSFIHLLLSGGAQESIIMFRLCVMKLHYCKLQQRVTRLGATQVADFNLSRVMEASSMQSSVAATNPRYVGVMLSMCASHLFPSYK